MIETLMNLLDFLIVVIILLNIAMINKRISKIEKDLEKQKQL